MGPPSSRPPHTEPSTTAVAADAAPSWRTPAEAHADYPGAEVAAVGALSLAEKARLTAGSGTYRTAAGLRLSDGPNGVRGERFDEREVALCTPCATALATPAGSSPWPSGPWRPSRRTRWSRRSRRRRRRTPRSSSSGRPTTSRPSASTAGRRPCCARGWAARSSARRWEDGGWRPAAGPLEIRVGRSSRDIRLTAEVVLTE